MCNHIKLVTQTHSLSESPRLALSMMFFFFFYRLLLFEKEIQTNTLYFLLFLRHYIQLYTVNEKVRDLFARYLTKADYWKRNLRPTDTTMGVEKLMYYCAMQMVNTIIFILFICYFILLLFII